MKTKEIKTSIFKKFWIEELKKWFNKSNQE